MAEVSEQLPEEGHDPPPEVRQEWRQARRENAERWFRETRDGLIRSREEEAERREAEAAALRLAAEEEAVEKMEAQKAREEEERVRALVESVIETMRGEPGREKNNIGPGEAGDACQKPVVLLYSCDAPTAERLFVRALFGALEAGGLAGKVWFDWNEGFYNDQRRQLKRLEALDGASAAIVVVSTSYLKCQEFRWEAALMRTRLHGRFGQQPFALAPLQYEATHPSPALVPGGPAGSVPSLLCEGSDGWAAGKRGGVEDRVRGALEALGKQLAGVGLGLRSAADVKIPFNAFGLSTDAAIEYLAAAHAQPYPFKSKPLETWTVFDTQAWVESQGAHLRKYARRFLSMEIDGFFLPHLCREDLAQYLGVVSEPDRAWLLRDLAAIAGQCQRREVKIRRELEEAMAAMSLSSGDSVDQKSPAKPVIVLYAPEAPMEERLFARSLAHTLESAGLEGRVWFDWHEGVFNSKRRQLCRLQALDAASFAIVVQSPSYIKSEEFHLEAKMMRTRVVEGSGAHGGPLAIVPVVYGRACLPCQHAAPGDPWSLFVAPDYRINIGPGEALSDSVAKTVEGVRVLMWVEDIRMAEKAEVRLGPLVPYSRFELQEAYALPRAYKSKPAGRWSAADAAVWLRDLGPRFSKHAAKLEELGLDGFYLPHVKNADLERLIGVESAADREVLMDELAGACQ